MQRKNENIDRIFKNALGDYRAIPDDKIWQRISERLAKRRKNRTLFLVTRIAAGIALVSALGFILHFVIRTRDRERPPFENVASTNQTHPGLSERNVDTLLEYLDSTSGQGITYTSEEVQGPPAPPQQAGTGQAMPGQTARRGQPTLPDQAGMPDKNFIADQNIIAGQPVITDQPVIPGQAVLPDQTVIPEQKANSGQTPMPDQTIMAVTNAGEKAIRPLPPLPFMVGRKAGYLPVLYGEGGLQEGLPGRMSETYLQKSLVQATEGEQIHPEVSGSPWALGGALAPFYSYRRIASDDLDNSQLTALNDAESGILAYAGGLNVSYAVSGRFSIQSGLYYSRYGQEKEVVTQYRAANADFDLAQTEFNPAELDGISVTNSTGLIANSDASPGSNDFLVIASASSYSYDHLEDITAVQYFDFLEFPLVLRYKLIDRRMDFSLMGGVLTSMLVGNRVYLKQNNDADYFGKTLNIRSVNYVGTVGLGVEYPISGSFTVNLEPRFGYYLRSIDTSSEIRVHPYSFGIYTGVSYRF